MLVFVYGTLRKGEVNHNVLGNSPLVGVFRTEPRFTLHAMRWFPAMVAGGSTSVVGEVYEVEARTLWEIDRLEGHPSYYQRRHILLDDGQTVQAYLMPAEGACDYPVIDSGDWLDRGE